MERRVEISSYGDPKLNISDYDEEDDQFTKEFSNFDVTNRYNAVNNNGISSEVHATNAGNNSRDYGHSGFADFVKTIEKRAQEDDYNNNNNYKGDERWSGSEQSVDKKNNTNADDDFFKSGVFDSDDDQSDGDIDFSVSKAGGYTSDKESNMKSDEKTSENPVVTSVQLQETPDMYNTNNERYEKKHESMTVKQNKRNAETRRNRNRKKRRHRYEFFPSY
uniref:Uncharacterized protein n=1 Tax=Trichobilharzia regenti TaxID=157069 RepID=A0AA85KNU8_TRIRE|nr:unnamed protein product [Trichobilharzia regenti]